MSFQQVPGLTRRLNYPIKMQMPSPRLDLFVHIFVMSGDPVIPVWARDDLAMAILGHTLENIYRHAILLPDTFPADVSRVARPVVGW